MADCSNTPTPESTANFDLDSRCFSEVMTSNADYTTAKASDGNVKKTLAQIEREANAVYSSANGVHKGDYSLGVIYSNYNEYYTYDNGGTIQQWSVKDTVTLDYVTTQANPNNDPNLTLRGDSSQEYVDLQIRNKSKLKFKSVIDVSLASPPVDSVICVSDRFGAEFLVSSGGTPDGLSIIDAGSGNTAQLVVKPWMLVEYLGITGTDDALLFSEASRLGYNVAAIQGKTYNVNSIGRIHAGSTWFIGNSTMFNEKGSGAMFCNGELNNASYATGYDGDGNITIYGGIWDCNGTDGGSDFTGALAFGHGENIRVINPTLKNATGSHYFEICGCKDVFIEKPVFKNHYLPSNPNIGFYEAVQIDFMGGSGQFGFFGSYDNTPCKNIHVTDFISEQGDVVVGSHTPTAADNKHSDIYITGVSNSQFTGAVSALCWKNYNINVTTGDSGADSVKTKGGCEDGDVIIHQATPASGSFSVFKSEETSPQVNRNMYITITTAYDTIVESSSIVRLNKAKGVTLKGVIQNCNNSALSANDSTFNDISFATENAAINGGLIVNMSNCFGLSTSLKLNGANHTYPLSVSFSSLGTSQKLMLNGVTWTDGNTGTGQPQIPLGVELNGKTSLIADPSALTGANVDLAHDVQNFDYFLVVTGFANGGSLTTEIIHPYSFPDAIGKDFGVRSSQGLGTLQFPTATTVTWDLKDNLRAIYGITMK